MKIFIWEKPGTFIENEVKARELEALIMRLEECTIEAAVALSHFEKEQKVMSATLSQILDQGPDVASRKRAIEILEEKNGPASYGDGPKFVRQSVDIERLTLELQIQAGAVPRQYSAKSVWIYAKSFVNTADEYAKFLKKLVDMDNREKNQDALKEFLAYFPDLRGVRNSVAHTDERMNRKTRVRGKLEDIEIQPINIPMMKGKVQISQGLRDNIFGSTMSNGHYGEIEVSEASVETMMNTLKSVYSNYSWLHGPIIIPSY